jgi:hypothetical protein
VTLVQLTFEFYTIEAKLENLIGGRAYDSDPLDAELREQGIEMIAPHKSNRVKHKTQDGRRLSRYEEYYPLNFPGLVQLAAICILLRHF